MLALIIHLTKKLGYTALVGVSPKVLPTFVSIYNHTANKTLGYNALMGVPPKVQSTFVNIYNYRIQLTEHWVTLHLWVCYLKYRLRLLTFIIIQLTKHWITHTALLGVPPKVQPTFADIIIQLDRVIPDDAIDRRKLGYLKLLVFTVV